MTYVAAIVGLIVTPAFAADMALKAPPLVPAPQAPSWTGFYIGADAGAAFWSPDQRLIGAFPSVVGTQLDPVDFSPGRQSGAVGGFLAGYNWQFNPNWLVGVEGDFNWTSLSTTGATSNLTEFNAPTGNNNILQMSQSVDWLASVRGRVGYVWAQSLWYVTGGGAWERARYSGQLSLGLNSIFESTPDPISKTNSGWVAGGGVEYMATPHMLVRLEFLSYEFPGFTTTAACTPAGTPCPNRPPRTNLFSVYSWSSNNVQTLRAAVSYKF
jgi:outer membrane immunogenic protein